MTNIFKQSKDFTQEERKRLLEQFHGSGLAFQDFAKEHNLNASTLKNWIWLETKPRFISEKLKVKRGAIWLNRGNCF